MPGADRVTFVSARRGVKTLPVRGGYVDDGKYLGWRTHLVFFLTGYAFQHPFAPEKESFCFMGKKTSAGVFVFFVAFGKIRKGWRGKCVVDFGV